MSPFGFSKQEKFECAKREVEQRRRVYGKLVAAGKMRRAEADREIALMTAIRDDYRDATDLFSGGL